MNRVVALDRVVVGLVVLGMAVLAWLALTMSVNVPVSGVYDPLGLVLFVSVWGVGMAAMMLPSLLPMVFALVLVSRQAVDEGGNGLSVLWRKVVGVLQFVFAYLGIWLGVGVVAYAGLVLLFRFSSAYSDLTRYASLASGGTVFFAGLYQLTPLKRLALEACRSPMSFIMTRWRSGRYGRFLMGVDYGFFCTRCCWFFMAVLLLVGAMNMLWMVLFTMVIFIEKVVPNGVGVSKALSVLLMIAGAALAGLSTVGF